MHLSNNTGISLPIAVWLAADGYDFSPDGKAISATSLLKPARQILLRERLNEQNQETPDVSQYIASRLGHAIHDSVEKTWKTDYADSLRKLGYPESVVQRVVVNPDLETLTLMRSKGMEPIPVYLEQRVSKEYMGYRISGKFDMILNGELQDFKSTSTFSYTHGSKDEDYRLQGSIYRWLNPEKITEDHMHIQFIFTDWQKFRARQDPNYPQQRVLPYRIELMSLEDTEAWITAKFRALEAAADLPEEQIPFCTDKDLWKEADSFKFYLDPAKANDPNSRATKRCDTMAEALAYQSTKGGRGVIVTVPGKVKACGYCPAFSICSQKDLYEHG